LCAIDFASAVPSCSTGRASGTPNPHRDHARAALIGHQCRRQLRRCPSDPSPLAMQFARFHAAPPDPAVLVVSLCPQIAGIIDSFCLDLICLPARFFPPTPASCVKTGSLRNETAVDRFLRMDTIGEVEGWHERGSACNSNRFRGLRGWFPGRLNRKLASFGASHTVTQGPQQDTMVA